jgi:hypothetical protein
MEVAETEGLMITQLPQVHQIQVEVGGVVLDFLLVGQEEKVVQV